MSEKLNSEHLAEIGKYFHPVSQICTKLPDVKSVRDFSKVFIKNPDGTHNSYEMVSGKWIKTGMNLTT
jgi:hypothetical protein